MFDRRYSYDCKKMTRTPTFEHNHVLAKKIKREAVIYDIFKHLNFIGARMLFRYYDEKGRMKTACLDGRKVVKCIEWDYKPHD